MRDITSNRNRRSRRDERWIRRYAVSGKRGKFDRSSQVVYFFLPSFQVRIRIRFRFSCNCTSILSFLRYSGEHGSDISEDAIFSLVWCHSPSPLRLFSHKTKKPIPPRRYFLVPVIVVLLSRRAVLSTPPNHPFLRRPAPFFDRDARKFRAADIKGRWERCYHWLKHIITKNDGF